MKGPATWSVMLLFAVLTEGCGREPNTTGSSQEATPAAEKEIASSTDPAQEATPAAGKEIGNSADPLQEATPIAGKVITNSIGMKLVCIPAGEFTMGSPEDEKSRDDDEKQHRVRITKPFYLGMHEVTVRDFRQFADDTAYETTLEKGRTGSTGPYDQAGTWSPDLVPKRTWRSHRFDQDDSHPVAYVSWSDAKAFCGWLSKKESRTYRLPTEAEWEYACRAGTTTRYYCGDDEEGLTNVGNVADASLAGRLPLDDWGFRGLMLAKVPTIASNDGYAFTSPVGSFRPNSFGLCDMHGNVGEWCADWYHRDYNKESPLTDPTGSMSGSSHLSRGGGWGSRWGHCRSADRFLHMMGWISCDLGFRVALDPAR